MRYSVRPNKSMPTPSTEEPHLSRPSMGRNQTTGNFHKVVSSHANDAPAATGSNCGRVTLDPLHIRDDHPGGAQKHDEERQNQGHDDLFPSRVRSCECPVAQRKGQGGECEMLLDLE